MCNCFNFWIFTFTKIDPNNLTRAYRKKNTQRVNRTAAAGTGIIWTTAPRAIFKNNVSIWARRCRQNQKLEQNTRRTIRLNSTELPHYRSTNKASTFARYKFELSSCSTIRFGAVASRQRNSSTPQSTRVFVLSTLRFDRISRFSLECEDNLRVFIN